MPLKTCIISPDDGIAAVRSPHILARPVEISAGVRAAIQVQHLVLVNLKVADVAARGREHTSTPRKRPNDSCTSCKLSLCMDPPLAGKCAMRLLPCYRAGGWQTQSRELEQSTQPVATVMSFGLRRQC